MDRPPKQPRRNQFRTAKQIPTFQVPYWVLMASYSAIALGTLSGGWRIVHDHTSGG